MAQHCVVDGAMAGGLTANKDDTANTLSAEMAAKVIDCDRNNDLGPLHAQISEGVPDLSDVEHHEGRQNVVGPAASSTAPASETCLRRKERPVMNKTGECFVKHVYEHNLPHQGIH